MADIPDAENCIRDGSDVVYKMNFSTVLQQSQAKYFRCLFYALILGSELRPAACSNASKMFSIDHILILYRHVTSYRNMWYSDHNNKCVLYVCFSITQEQYAQLSVV
jgi:hypothetical protein